MIARLKVSGRVQGVFYRGSARQRAVELGITGHARNQPDGTVEILACGSEEAVREFTSWLWIGPPLAKVTAVEPLTGDLPLQPPPYFSTD